jgi:hypothetical protein
MNRHLPKGATFPWICHPHQDDTVEEVYILNPHRLQEVFERQTQEVVQDLPLGEVALRDRS